MTASDREATLLAAVCAQPVPEHVAIIMDGNGRWATGRGLPRIAGHREGVKAARGIVRAADALGLRVLGQTRRVPLGVRRGIDHVVHETRNNTGLTVLMAFNYGGRDELLDAFRALARQVQAGDLKPDDISEKDVSGALYTADIPDPDLLIRTSGEMRISNFLLRQMASTELVITPTLWPDFGPGDLYRAVGEFQGRTRRFGKV